MRPVFLKIAGEKLRFERDISVFSRFCRRKGAVSLATLFCFCILSKICMMQWAAAPIQNVRQFINVRGHYGQLPLSFEPNKGQIASKAEFLSRSNGFTLLLGPSEAALLLSQPEKGPACGSKNSVVPPDRSKWGFSTDEFRMMLVGANSKAPGVGEDILPGKSNYFSGNDPKRWKTKIPQYEKVEFQGVYPGIDMVYYGNQRQLEYDFVVNPAADYRKIEWEVPGRDELDIDADGNLLIKGAARTLSFKKPVCHVLDSDERSVLGNFVLKGKNHVGFDVSGYDGKGTLVIDPVLNYSTYLGPGLGTSIAVDAEGDAYITGHTGDGIPTTSGAYETSTAGPGDIVFVTKLNPSGTALIYSTFIGGVDTCHANGIAVDLSDCAYITGFAQTASDGDSWDYPTYKGYQQIMHEYQNAFVTKLSADGSALVYSTFLGGAAPDQGNGIAVDGSGNAYVAGGSGGSNFPTTVGAFQTSDGGAFVTKLNASGDALVYSSIFGGYTMGGVNGIAVDVSGEACVTGITGAGFPVTSGAYDATYEGGTYEVFVAKFNAAGSGLVYGTYLDGANCFGNSIALDLSGNAYVTGEGYGGVPGPPGSYQDSGGGRYEAFVTKFSPSGSLVGGSDLGGIENAYGYGIAVDNFGCPTVVGYTEGGFPTTAGAYQTVFQGVTGSAGPGDAFVTKFNANFTGLIYSTYLGGNQDTYGYGVAEDSNGDAFVTGNTAGDFPVTSGAYQTSYTGVDLEPEAFVSMFVFPTPTPTPSNSPTSTCSPTFSVSPTGTATPSISPTSTCTPTFTTSPTITTTSTPTPYFSATNTPTSAATSSPTETPSSTPTGSPVFSAVPTAPAGGPLVPAAGQSYIMPSPIRGGERAAVVVNLSGAGEINLVIFNERAEPVLTESQEAGAGSQSVGFSSVGFARGIYFYAVKIDYDSGGKQSCKPGKFLVLTK